VSQKSCADASLNNKFEVPHFRQNSLQFSIGLFSNYPIHEVWHLLRLHLGMTSGHNVGEFVLPYNLVNKIFYLTSIRVWRMLIKNPINNFVSNFSADATFTLCILYHLSFLLMLCSKIISWFGRILVIA